MAHILVVDDDPAIRLLLTDMLSREGHQVSAAENGRVARDFYGKTAIDLAIVDLMMPDVDGMEVLAEIHFVERDIKVLLMSSADEFLPVVEDLGADRVMAKPLDRETVLEAVRHLLSP